MNGVEDRFASILSRSWWLLLLRGVLAIAFGIAAWVMPGISLAVLLLLFGSYALVDGVFGVWSAIAGREHHEHWWVLLLGGLLGIGVGLITLFAPAVTALVVLFYIAIWAIATGVLQIVSAVRLRKEIQGEWLLGLAGLGSVVFGVLLMVQPEAGALALLWLIGSYAIAFGVLLVILAFRARRFVGSHSAVARVT